MPCVPSMAGWETVLGVTEWKPAPRLGREGNCPVRQGGAVESRRQLLAGRVPVDLIDWRSGVQERSVPILEPVVGVADVAAHFELDMSDDRAEVVLLKNSGRLRPATYCVEPTWMKLTQSIWVLQVEVEPGSWQAANKRTVAIAATSLEAIQLNERLAARPGNDYFLAAPMYLPGSLSKLSLHPPEQK